MHGGRCLLHCKAVKARLGSVVCLLLVQVLISQNEKDFDTVQKSAPSLESCGTRASREDLSRETCAPSFTSSLFSSQLCLNERLDWQADITWHWTTPADNYFTETCCHHQTCSITV
jgi:hypothetical protein